MLLLPSLLSLEIFRLSLRTDEALVDIIELVWELTKLDLECCQPIIKKFGGAAMTVTSDKEYGQRGNVLSCNCTLGSSCMCT